MSNLVRRIAILQLLSHAYCTQRYWLDLLLKPYSNYPDISLLSLLLPSSFFDQHVSILMTTPLFLFIRRTCGWIYLSSLLAQLFTRRTGLKSRTSLLPLWSAVISLCLLACFDCVYPLQSPILTGISLWISFRLRNSGTSAAHSISGNMVLVRISQVKPKFFIEAH